MATNPIQLTRNLVPDAPEFDTPWVHEVACHDCNICELSGRVLPPELERFTREVLVAHKVPVEEASTIARVLVNSDERGIASHGVARLPRYLNGIKDGIMLPGIEMVVDEPVPALAVVDARNGMGQVAGELGMTVAIRKAKDNGIGMVTVQNSNHYGIAGYYSLMAVEQGLIGISLTNSAPLVVPTFGVDLMLGTNPIAFGAPAKKHPPFLLDMATSVVPRGKLEVYHRNMQQMPAGWAIDQDGYDCLNPGQILDNMIKRLGGGILPLGGRGETFSGYKGYGMAFLVDILCGVLSGASFGDEVNDLKGKKERGEPVFPNVGHCFIAIDIQRFIPLEEFENRLDKMIATIASSKKAVNQDTIYIHGEKEYAKTQIHRDVGIPISQNVFDTLTTIGNNAGVQPLQVQPALTQCKYKIEATKDD